MYLPRYHPPFSPVLPNVRLPSKVLAWDWFYLECRVWKVSVLKRVDSAVCLCGSARHIFYVINI